MKGFPIRYRSRGRTVPFFRAPELTSSSAGSWAGFTFEEARGSGEALALHAWPKTTLIYVTSGRASLRWRHRGVWRDEVVEPGSVSIMKRDVEIQNAVPTGTISMMVLQLDDVALTEQAPCEVTAIERSLVPALVVRDSQLARLLSTMRTEVQDGCRSGRLFAESLSTTLLAYLSARYASESYDVTERRSSFSESQMRLLNTFISDNIAAATSVSDLAMLVGMSPSHFTRVFKATSGLSPHQYVMRERVRRAKSLLKNSGKSSTSIALETGFASQSHFSKVFLQFTGLMPRQYRYGK